MDIAVGGCRWGLLGGHFLEVADGDCEARTRVSLQTIASATILDCQRRRLSTNRKADDEMNLAKLHHCLCPTLGVPL
jgi:hypothetical protein